VGLDESRALKARRKEPQELVRGELMRVKHLEDHCAADPECLKTGKGLCRKETLDGVFLAIIVRTEVKAAVGRVEVGTDAAEVVVCGEDERALVREVVEVASAVGAVGNSDGGVANQELLGLPPAGDGALRGAEGHCDRPGAGCTVLDRFQETAGAFGAVGSQERGGRCGESEGIPELNHLEVTAAQGLDGGDGAVHPLLE
jgi:hypothetical protein